MSKTAEMPKIYPKEETKITFVEDVYYPTRLEYFAAAALQGLLPSFAEKKYDSAAINAVKIARSMEVVLDQAQD